MSVIENHEESFQEASVESVQLTPGQLLKAHRENCGLSVEAIAKELRLSERMVFAIESDDYQTIGAATFVRGYLRSYARILSVPQTQIDRLLAAVQLQEPSSAMPLVQGVVLPIKTRRYQRRGLLVVALAFLVLVGFLGFYLSQNEGNAALGLNQLKPIAHHETVKVDSVPLQISPSRSDSPVGHPISGGKGRMYSHHKLLKLNNSK